MGHWSVISKEISAIVRSIGFNIYRYRLQSLLLVNNNEHVDIHSDDTFIQKRITDFQ